MASMVRGTRRALARLASMDLDEIQLDLGAPVAELARRLVDIPSVSGDEGAIADAVEAALRGYPHLRVARNGNAVVAALDTGAAERVILAGHLDTVPIND